LEPPVSRPHVLLSAAVSLDGYLDTRPGEDRLILSNPEDFDRVDSVRASIDAILVGAGTLRADNPRLLVNSAQRRADRLAAGLPEYPLKVRGQLLQADGNGSTVGRQGPQLGKARPLMGARLTFLYITHVVQKLRSERELDQVGEPSRRESTRLLNSALRPRTAQPGEHAVVHGHQQRIALGLGEQVLVPQIEPPGVQSFLVLAPPQALSPGDKAQRRPHAAEPVVAPALRTDTEPMSVSRADRLDQLTSDTLASVFLCHAQVSQPHMQTPLGQPEDRVADHLLAIHGHQQAGLLHGLVTPDLAC
jgi:hypothetical protein